MGLSKIGSLLEKSGTATGFNDPDCWLSTGNKAINYRITGDFNRGIPNRRTVFLYGLSGCVDAETEFFTPDGWKRIDQYTDGDLVMQFDPDTNETSFVAPSEYVKLPMMDEELFTHYTSDTGIDMMLSDEHRVLYKDTVGKWEVETSRDVREMMEFGELSGTIANTFVNGDIKINEVDPCLLSLAVAIFTEGEFIGDDGLVRIRYKHKYQEHRLRELLVHKNEYSKNLKVENGYYEFTSPFNVDVREFPKEWYGLNPECFGIILDELVWWDNGQHLVDNRIFRTQKKEIADFIQFAAASSGFWSSIKKGHKGIEVHFSERKECGLDYTKVEQEESVDGFKYCFTVPTGYLVLRRNGNIFLTGNSGKSLTACIAAKNAQEKGYQVIYIDSEESLNTDYADKIGLDYNDPDKFLLVRVSTLEELTKVMATLFRELDPDEKICYIIDSLTNMETEREQEGFDKGETKNDMGLFAKRSKAIVKNINNKISKRDNFCIFINHSYMNQDIRNGEGTEIPSGGKGIIYLPSLTLHLKKLKLKEGTEQIGIKCRFTIEKNRFGKIGDKVTIEIPYESGVDEYDGVADILIEKGIIKKAGGWLELPDGTKIRKAQLPEYFDMLVGEE